MKSTEIFELYKAASLQEAQLLCDVLGRAGLNARIASNAIGPLAPEIPVYHATCPIWVPIEEAEVAKKVLQTWQAKIQQGANENELYCYHCGVHLEQRAAVCPDCDQELDWA